jgi:hypothetical protein
MIKTKSVATKIDRQKDGLRILVARGRGRGLPANRYNMPADTSANFAKAIC